MKKAYFLSGLIGICLLFFQAPGRLSAEAESPPPPSDTTFLVDVSASMRGVREVLLSILFDSFSSFPDSRDFSYLSYHSVPSQSVSADASAEFYRELLPQEPFSGYSNSGEGLLQALSLTADRGRILWFTDGETDMKSARDRDLSFSRLMEGAALARERGISLTVYSFSEGEEYTALCRAAEESGGRVLFYHSIGREALLSDIRKAWEPEERDGGAGEEERTEPFDVPRKGELPPFSLPLLKPSFLYSAPPPDGRSEDRAGAPRDTGQESRAEVLRDTGQGDKAKALRDTGQENRAGTPRDTGEKDGEEKSLWPLALILSPLLFSGALLFSLGRRAERERREIRERGRSISSDFSESAGASHGKHFY